VPIKFSQRKYVPDASQQQLVKYNGTSQSNGQKGEATTLAHLGSAFYPNPERKRAMASDFCMRGCE